MVPALIRSATRSVGWCRRAYLLVDDAYRIVTFGGRVRQRGPDPKLSDVEVLTMEIFGEQQGRHNDAAIHRYSHEGVVSQAVIAISSSYVYPFVRLDAAIPSSRPALPDTGARSDRPAPSRGVPPAAPRGWDGRRWPVASTRVSWPGGGTADPSAVPGLPAFCRVLARAPLTWMRTEVRINSHPVGA